MERFGENAHPFLSIRKPGRKGASLAAWALQHPAIPPPCFKNPKPTQTLPLGWGSTPPVPGSLKHCFRLKNQFSVPNAGLSEASPCPTTAASYPLVSPGPCPAPRLSGPAQASRTKGGNRGCRRVLATPPVLDALGRLCPAGRRATRGVLGADGPSGAQGRRQGGRGPDMAGGRPGWSAVRLRERRRTRGAYCW